jgi:hypothetical protein
MPELNFIGTKFTGGVGTEWPPVCIESRDVFEKEDGPPSPLVRLLLLLPHRKIEVHDRPFELPVDDAFREVSDGAVILASDDCGDFERDFLVRQR